MTKKHNTQRQRRRRALFIYEGGTLDAKSIAELIAAYQPNQGEDALGKPSVFKDYNPDSPYVFSHTSGDTPTGVIWPVGEIGDAYHEVMRALTPSQLPMNVACVCVLVDNPNTPHFKHFKTQLERFHKFEIEWGGDKAPRIKVVVLPAALRCNAQLDSKGQYDKAVALLNTRLLRAFGVRPTARRPAGARAATLHKKAALQ